MMHGQKNIKALINGPFFVSWSDTNLKEPCSFTKVPDGPQT